MTGKISVGPVTVYLNEGDRILTHLRDPEKGFTWEPATLAAWASMVRPGSSVIDVGCYSGIFSISAMKLGALPVGIEPMPNLCKLIKKNLELNDLPRFRLIRAAATDAVGTIVLHYNEKVPFTAGCSVERKSGAILFAPAITIDALGVKQCSAMKIDVERHEMAVLRGSMETLRRERPKLIVEVLDKAARAAVEDLLSDMYRTTALLDTRNLIMVPR